MGRVAAALVFFWVGCGGSPCPDMCQKVLECQQASSQPCDKVQCQRICDKQRSDGGGLGFGDELQCVLDTSCSDLSRNACFYTALRLDQWCVPVSTP